MQKYDWRRLFSEVRPTFLPYARFTGRTRLSPEECREKLAAVTQPQKMPSLFSIRTSDDPRLSLKGQFSDSGFLVVPIGKKPVQGGSRTAKPFFVIGKFRPASGGTDLAVQVLPDPLGTFIMFGLLSAVIFAAAVTCSLPSSEKFIFELFWLAQIIFVLAVLGLPASFEAYRTKKMLERLLA